MLFPSFFSLRKHLDKCLFQIHQLQDPTEKSQDDSSLQTSVIFKIENILESNSSNNTNNFVIDKNIVSDNIENCVKICCSIIL